MKFLIYFLRLFFSFLLSYLLYSLTTNFFSPILEAYSLIFPYALHPFDICLKIPIAWYYIKLIFKITLLYNLFFFTNSLLSLIFPKSIKFKSLKYRFKSKKIKNLCLYIGRSFKDNSPILINEKSLYQNILITGTIGSGKTSSAMYPFCKQLIDYSHNNIFKKIGMLILDVKGNFYSQILKYAVSSKREDDLIIIELNGLYKYNPLHKPHLSAQVLANRLKSILLLFSPNNSESYWLDECEKVLEESIKLCRLYNNGYVTFKELHNIITKNDYYLNKLSFLKQLFRSGKLSKTQIYDLYSSLSFFENEFTRLDSRTLSILKSEITRITHCFVSNYDVLNTFSPAINELNFLGFEDVIKCGKIVVLNMNISEHQNLSKIIAAYLKLDFQSEVISQLSKNETIHTTAFICDEYHEYVTLSDSNFFAQSREAKCINIVATQSYSSLLNSLKDSSTVKVITQNLINKLWFRTDDSATIEDVQKQIGKEEKHRLSKSISENAKETNYNYFTRKLISKNSNISESINDSINFDYVYDFKFFTQELETFSCLGFLSDGTKILPPQKIRMQPYFLKNFKLYKKG